MTRDSDLTRVFERSAIVAALERAGRRVDAAIRDSRLLARGRSYRETVRVMPGATLLIATATHIILQGTIARPPHWYWLILPFIFGLGGVLLLIMVDRAPRRRD